MLHLDEGGRLIGKLSTQCEGAPLRKPNDVTLDYANPDAFYFTDPGGSGVKNPIGTVHYVDKFGKTHLFADGMAFPNGLVMRPDGKTLLVAESQYNRILEFEIAEPGKAGKKRVFAELPKKSGEQIDNQPDGICLDSAGNLYVAHYGMRQVQVVDPSGKVIRRYPGGNLTTSNVAFAGEKRDQLFVTGAIGGENGGRGGVFRLNLKGVTGLPVLPDALD
jgi:gluconolactonase